jgi:putative serine protease PepD
MTTENQQPTEPIPAVPEPAPAAAPEPDLAPAAGAAYVAPAPYINGPYGVPPQEPTVVEGEPPVWAVPPAAAAPAAAGPNRFGRVLVAGAAALVLALGSGVAGAWAALQLDARGSATTTTSSSANQPAAAAPVIDRSSLASIAAAVLPSVVSVDTGTGEGSGVVLTADGYVLTNNHVVATARNNAMTVMFSDGKSARATVVGTDARTDLAVIKAEGVSGLTPAKFGDSGSLRVGDTVLALGSPLGLEGSVTAGIVSALDRTIQASSEQRSQFDQPTTSNSISGVIQTDAAINPGNSGGALVNTNGEVVGINTAIATSGNSNGNIGVGFAIPSNRAVQVKDQLVQGEKVSHPQLGVNVANADGGGAVVSAVVAGSPADKAGLRQGDVITKVGDRTINDSDDLVSAIQSGNVGDRVDITYKRGDAVSTTTATLAEAS